MGLSITAKLHPQGLRLNRFLTAAVTLSLAVVWFQDAAAHERSPVILRGTYYPGRYYSQSYLQGLPVPEGAHSAHPVLVPYDEYGRHRLGTPFPPLTNGKVLSDRFPYRYEPDFVPVPFRRPVLPDPCDLEERLRHQVTYPAPFVPPLPIPHSLDLKRLDP